MALDTYAGLQAEVASLLNRQDLTVQIPSWVDLVEAELGRTLKGRDMRATVAVTFDDTGAFALPPDFVRPVSLTLETDLYQWPVAFKSYEYVIQKRAQLVNGPARYAAVVGSDIVFGPKADSTTGYAGVFIYDMALTPLSDANVTNWALSAHPDLYLYGCAYHSAPWLKDDERIAMWKDYYFKALSQIEALRNEAEWDGNTIVTRPVSALGE